MKTKEEIQAKIKVNQEKIYNLTIENLERAIEATICNGANSVIVTSKYMSGYHVFQELLPGTGYNYYASVQDGMAGKLKAEVEAAGYSCEDHRDGLKINL